MSLFRSLLALTVVLCCARPSPAAAQIYSWRDADGKLVLSDKPRAGQRRADHLRSARRGVGSGRPPARARATRARRTTPPINEHARRQGVAADLVRAVIQVESAFNPDRRLEQGRDGPDAVDARHGASSSACSNPFDPDQNIRGGVTYLKQLLNRYDQKVELALAAYNAGIGNVDKVRRRCRRSKRPATTSTRSPRPPRRSRADEDHLQVDGAGRRQARDAVFEQAPRLGLLRDRRPLDTLPARHCPAAVAEPVGRAA